VWHSIHRLHVLPIFSIMRHNRNHSGVKICQTLNMSFRMSTQPSNFPSQNTTIWCCLSIVRIFKRKWSLLANIRPTRSICLQFLQTASEINTQHLPGTLRNYPAQECTHRWEFWWSDIKTLTSAFFFYSFQFSFQSFWVWVVFSVLTPTQTTSLYSVCKQTNK